MTISKKLLISGVLLLGMQQIAQAHTNDVNYEVSQILNFAQTLRQVNNLQALRVAHWLERQAYELSDAQDYDILAIAKVINNPDLTMPSKISALSQTMEIEIIKNICWGIALTAVCVAYITIPLWKKTPKGGEYIPREKQ